jgi:hypothetical protein
MTNTFQFISPYLAFFHKETSSPQSSRELKVFKEGLNKHVIPAQAGIQGLQDQRVTGSPLSRG